MKQLAMMLLGALALLHGAPALGKETQAINHQQFWVGTKPVVWSLRAGSYSGRQPSVSLGVSARQEIAGSKPVLWSLRMGKEQERQPILAIASEQPASPCWGTKPVVRSLGHCAEETLEVGSAGGQR
jgi:hypothetical protein